jgi:hypothetical protein
MAGLLSVGERVSYLAPTGGGGYTRWRAAIIVSVTDQSNLVLGIKNGDGSVTNLNGGVAVPLRTASTQTNVWRHF